MFNKDSLSNLDFNDTKQVDAFAEEVVKKMAEENKSLKEVLSISDKFLEDLYALAYAFYNQGKFQEAARVFHYLVSISSEEYKYMLGLAGSLHQLKEYEGAATIFYLAQLLAPEDPHPSFYAADSLLKIDQKAEAKEFLDIAIEIAGKKSEFAKLKERSKLIKKSL